MNIEQPQQWAAVGRRKTSVARIYLRPGNGTITVNGRSFENYFPRATNRALIMQAFEAVNVVGQFDVLISVAGGGGTGQAARGAPRHHPRPDPEQPRVPGHAQARRVHHA